MYREGMQRLIDKLLAKPGACMQSIEWVPKYGSLGWQAERVGDDVHLFACERWPRATKVIRIVRFTITHGALQPWVDVTYEGKRYDNYYSANGVLRAAMDAFRLTLAEQGQPCHIMPRYSSIYARKAPRYVFLDENHPSCLGPKQYLALTTWDGTHAPAPDHHGADPAHIFRAFIMPGEWVRMDNYAQLTPLFQAQVPIARCDFKLARSNSKKALEVERTMFNFCRISGTDVQTLLREQRTSTPVLSNSVILGPAALQKYYDEHEEINEIAPFAHMTGYHLTRKHTKVVERVAGALDDNAPRWIAVPRVYKLAPVRREQMVTLVNTPQEMEAYAESFRRA